MKKLLSIIISSVVVAALSIGLIFILINVNNEKEYSLTIGASVGGNVQLIVDDTVHDITSNRTKSYTIKKKSKVTISALPTLGYEFVSWDIDGETSDDSAEKFELEISADTDVYANFELSSFNLTIVDGEFKEVFEYSPATNLLSTLNAKYSADEGYHYEYSIGDKAVDEKTTVSKETTITRKLAETVYSVIFKNNTTQVGDIQYYTISTKDKIQAPEIPSFENDQHYKDIEWEAIDLSTLGNKVFYLNKTPIKYSVEFKHNNEIIDSKDYTIEDEKVVGPTINDITADDYYTYDWPEYSLTYNDEMLTVTTIQRPIENTFIYKDTNGNVVKTITYTKDEFVNKNAEIFTAPELTENLEHYTLSWSDDLSTILEGNFEDCCGKTESFSKEITTVKTPINYFVTFKVNGEIIEGGDNTFNIDDLTISAPAINNATTGIYYEFNLPTLTVDDLGNNDKVISAEKYIKVTFIRKHRNGQTLGYEEFVMLKLNNEDKPETNDNGTIVLYDINLDKIDTSSYFSQLGTYSSYKPISIDIYDCNAAIFARVMNAVLVEDVTQPITIIIKFATK